MPLRSAAVNGRGARAANATRLPFGTRARHLSRSDAAPFGIGATLKPDRRRGQVARMKRRASERRPGASQGAHSAAPAHEHAVTVRDIVERKGARDRIVCVTAYDVMFARLVDESGVDIVLVGDSLGNVV